MDLSHASDILVVEDNSDIRHALRLALELEGYQVAEAKNGADALDFLSKCSELPKLIVLDLLMPVMSGWDFIGELAKDLSHPRAHIDIVILSATSEKIAQNMPQIRASLKKPINLGDLYGVIGNLISRD